MNEQEIEREQDSHVHGGSRVGGVVVGQEVPPQGKIAEGGQAVGFADLYVF